jgi:glycogen synthase
MTTDAVGGIWTYANELTSALRARGIDVALAVVGPAPRSAHGRVHLVGGALEWEDAPWEGVERAGERLLELADVLRADVVHLNGYAHAALPWDAPVMVVGHSCVLSWWEAVCGEQAPPRWNRYRDAVTAGLHAADAVVAPTAWMLDELRRLYGIEGGRVIHNGLAAASRPAPKEPVVLAAGRLWDRAKGLPALAEAAAAIEWPVEVAGEGGSAKGVRLLGTIPREELHERMARAAVFAHPARYEPFGLAPLEAAMARCALVLGDVPPLREVWDGGAAYVPPGDAEALAHTLRRLIADRSARERLAARALERASLYTLDRMTDAYVAEYSRMRQSEVALT